MPRPKPAQELKPRHIRLSDRQWARLQELGGSEWLRQTLSYRALRAVTAEKAERNRRMRIDRAAGVSFAELAKRYGISERTVFRVLE